MGLKIKLKKKGNQFNKILEQVRGLNRENVKVGHFKEQGTHHSGFTYPQLMAIHHNGGNTSDNVPLPPRPVLDILFFRNQKLTDPRFTLALKAWGKREPTEQSNNKLLEDIGKILTKKEREIFGSSALAPNAVPPKASNNPLVDTGDLRSKVAYKASTNKSIKEG